MITCTGMKILDKNKMNVGTGKRCCLLIPGYLVLEYRKIREQKGGLKVLLSYLVNKYYGSRLRFYVKRDIDTTVGYQEDGLFLHRENFRPVGRDWLELKFLAIAHNMSMCAFFVFLLQLELAGALEVGEVSPNPKPILLIQSLSGAQTQIYKRIFHRRV